MDSKHTEASVDTQATTFDSLAKSMRKSLPRRGVAGLLAAAVASGVFGISISDESAEAKRKRGKHGKRHNSYRDGLEAAKGTSIPPNCIYVCCDGTCDSWKMCMKCVKWPKPTTTTVAMASG